MALVSRLSLSTYLKNFFGVRGGYGPGVDESIAPVFDVGAPDPVNDDLVTYWVYEAAVGAVAAQFGFVGFSPQNGGRLIVDSAIVNPSSASSRLRFGRLAAQTPATYGNAPLARQAGSFGAGPPGVRQGQSGADPMTAGNMGSVEITVSPGPSIIVPLSIACKQGEEILFAQNTVNIAVRVTVFGRFYGSFPE